MYPSARTITKALALFQTFSIFILTTNKIIYIALEYLCES